MKIQLKGNEVTRWVTPEAKYTLEHMTFWQAEGFNLLHILLILELACTQLSQEF